jgi:hypothetical protein
MRELLEYTAPSWRRGVSHAYCIPICSFVHVPGRTPHRKTATQHSHHMALKLTSRAAGGPPCAPEALTNTANDTGGPDPGRHALQAAPGALP